MEESRILEKLDNISDRMARVETTVDGLSSRIDKYNDVTGRTRDLEHAVTTITNNCTRIQDEKRRWRPSPGVVIGGIIVSSIMLLIGYSAAKLFN